MKNQTQNKPEWEKLILDGHWDANYLIRYIRTLLAERDAEIVNMIEEEKIPIEDIYEITPFKTGINLRLEAIISRIKENV